MGTATTFYKTFSEGRSELIGGSFYSGPTVLGLARLITGVEDYKTLLEMATRGDRFKVDFGSDDVPIPEELKHLMPPFNFPLVQMSKASRAKLESGEITHDDIVASLFSGHAVSVERYIGTIGQVNGFKQAYIVGSSVQDNLFMQRQIGKYTGNFTNHPTSYFLEHGSHLGVIGNLV